MFNKKGMLDLLMTLKGGEMSFIELKTLKMSPNTILARLREAQRLNAVRGVLIERGNKKSLLKYSLTKKGRELLAAHDPIKADYLRLGKEIDKLEKDAEKKKQKIKLLLSHVKSP